MNFTHGVLGGGMGTAWVKQAILNSGMVSTKGLNFMIKHVVSLAVAQRKVHPTMDVKLMDKLRDSLVDFLSKENYSSSNNFDESG